jgi:hypothetical protein
MEAVVVGPLTQAHNPQAAGALAACFEGLILHRIARHDDSDPRPTIELFAKAHSTMSSIYVGTVG